MNKSVRIKKKIRSILLISLFGIGIGFLFTTRSFGFDETRMIKGMIGGLVITLSIGYLEFFVFKNNFKKLRFSVALLIRIVSYVTVISIAVIIIWVTHESSANGVSFFTTLKGNDFRHFIFEGDFKTILLFSVFYCFLINFFIQLNTLLGKNVLLIYLSGKYHKPIEEERVFMFLDLTSSTTIAEKLGPFVYHKFINSYFFDIDEPIVESKGEIYQYVGDEVVISWKNNSGFEDANCIRCYFNIRSRIDELSDIYKELYGVIPDFKAGLHCGKIVTGEVGDSKKEIVFHGDVLNTAARIMTQCNPLGKKFLTSGDVLEKLIMPEKFKSEYLGDFTLRGRAQKIELFNIEKV